MKKQNQRCRYWEETISIYGNQIKLLNPTIVFCDEQHMIDYIKARQYCSDQMGGKIVFGYTLNQTGHATLFGNKQVEEATEEEQLKGKSYATMY